MACGSIGYTKKQLPLSKYLTIKTQKVALLINQSKRDAAGSPESSRLILR